MITDKMKENAHKITYLMMQYPKHNMGEIIKLLQMPAIDINSAIWAAIELGMITEPDVKTGMAKVVTGIIPTEFGDMVKDLEAMLTFCFAKLGAKEDDLEESQLGTWTAGYPSHDVIIAMKRLLNGKILAEYTIDDVDDKGISNTYTFYTLYQNGEQLWGRKQFKKDPLTKKKK